MIRISRKRKDWKYMDSLEKLKKYIILWLYPVILLVFPFLSIRQGVDVSDTTYNLGNFQFFGQMDTNWKLSIFLPSVLGKILTLLPFSGTMLFMKIYTTLIICALVLCIYLWLSKWINKTCLFIGLFIAECLCWCPSVILYNYLTYICMSLAILFLLTGLWKDEKSQDKYLFIAGLFLGINVLVRLPNICECAFIIILWYYLYLQNVRTKAFNAKIFFMKLIRKTVICVLGFLLGGGCAFFIAVSMYGFDAYFGMISWLGAVSKDAEGSHSMASTFAATFEAYFKTLYDMRFLFGVIVLEFAAIVIFQKLLDRKGKESSIEIGNKAYNSTRTGFFDFSKIETKGILPVLLLTLPFLVIVRYYFAIGVYTRNYWYYDSMFKAAMMFIILSIILDFIVLIRKTESDFNRVLALTSLMIIIITPFGSDNYTYPIINNLFITAPVTLSFIYDLKGILKKFVPVGLAVILIVFMLIGQGILFKKGFSFVDGADGVERDMVVTKVPKAMNMISSSKNVTNLESLYEYLKEESLLDKKLLQFGNAPGLSYLFDMKPAIYTTWSLLPSNMYEDFAKSVDNMSKDTVIVIQKQDYTVKKSYIQKNDYLRKYMEQHGYKMTFENDLYSCYINY